jgi:hypothetical protein
MAITYDFTPANQKSGAIKNVGREFKLINIAGISDASVAAGNTDLDAELKALSTVCSITAVGAFTAGTDTEVNVMIEGMNFEAGSGAGSYADAYPSGATLNAITWLEYLNALSQTSATITEVSF